MSALGFPQDFPTRDVFKSQSAQMLEQAYPFRQPSKMNILYNPDKVIPLTNIFRDQPQNPNHVTLKLSLSHITFIRPSCISITNCDLTKKFILFDYLYTRLARTCPRLSTQGGSSSCPSSSIDEARKIKVEEASRVLIVLGVRESSCAVQRTDYEY